jgi:diaminopimelate decarboxylase
VSEASDVVPAVDQVDAVEEAPPPGTDAAPPAAPDAPIDLGLLPFTARLDATGRLLLGGLDVAGLADEFGTPLFVYDERHLRARCRDWARFLGGPANVAYASKAFLCRAMARLVDEEGLALDVSTAGELHAALLAGFPATRLVFHGNNKSYAELKRALEAGVGRIVVDSFDELVRLDGLGERGFGPARVLVRLNPGIDAGTHAHLATGAADSKFGFSIASGAAADACRWAHESPHIQLVGLHAHIGSQIHDPASYEASCRAMAGLAAQLQADHGARIDELNLGGGLGVRYLAADRPPSLNVFATGLRDAATKACEEAELSPPPRIVVEPGRSIAATGGITLYRIGTIKEIPGVRTYVAVDGGMSDNIRTVAYGAAYEAFLPAQAGSARPLAVAVAGKHCEQGDVIVPDAQLPAEVAVGDVLCTPVTGAYGYAMASNYNKVPRPAVVFVADGRARVVVRRESLDDLVRLDED